MKYVQLICVGFFLCGLGLPVSPLRAEQITNVTASGSSGISVSFQPMFAVNGAGLSGVTHANGFLSVVWLSAIAPINGAYFIIDLKKNYRLDAANTLRVWNYNQSGFTDVGIRAATFSYSLDSLTFTNIAGVTTDATNFPTTTFDQATGLATYSNYNTVAFNTNLTGRYLKITVNGGASVGNYGDPTYIVLSEVQAFGTFVSDPTNSLDAQITVSNATASSSYDPPNGNVTNLINGSGLTGLRHNTDDTKMWLTSNTVTAATLDFDLGVTKYLRAVRIWNFNQASWGYDRGMRTVDILVSDDPTFTSGVITNYNDIELLSAPFEYGVYDNPQIIDMKRVRGRYVRLSNIGNSNLNWGSTTLSGLSEVQFFQYPPPPAGTVFTFH